MINNDEKVYIYLKKYKKFWLFNDILYILLIICFIINVLLIFGLSLEIINEEVINYTFIVLICKFFIKWLFIYFIFFFICGYIFLKIKF